MDIHSKINLVTTLLIGLVNWTRKDSTISKPGLQCKLTVPLEPLTVSVGSDIILPCHLTPETSAVSLEVRWYKGSSGELVHQYTDRRETEGPGYQGRVQLFHQELERGNVSLLLKDVRTSDQSTYICHVYSLLGDELDSQLEMLVTGLQYKLTVPLEPLSVSVGSDIVLPCHLTPETSAVSLEVRWCKGSSGELVHQYTDRRETEGPGYQGRVQLFHQELERGNVSLLLKDVRTSDQNIYTCHIKSVQGDELDSQLEMLVTEPVSEDLPTHAPPSPVTGLQCKLTVPLEPLSVSVGSDIVLPCHLTPETSVVSLEVRWCKGSSGELVHQYTDRRETEGPGYQGRVQLFHQELERGNVSLLLKDVRTSDQNIYTCHIKSVQGDELDSQLEMLVTDSVSEDLPTPAPPVVITDQFTLMVPSKSLSGNVGRDIVLPCHLTPETSAVSLEVRWYKGSSGELVHQYTDRRETEGPGYQGRVQLFHQELERGNVSLLLEDIRITDQGIYTCQVSSGFRNKLESKLKIVVRGQKHGQPLSSHWDHRREGFVLGMAVALMVFILFQWMKNRKTQGKKSRGLRNTCLGLIFLSAVVGGLLYTGKLPQELSGMMPCDDADSCLPVVSAAVTILISTYSFIRVVRVQENPGIKTEVAVPSWFLPTLMGFGVGLFVGIGSICLYFIMKSKQGLPENIAAYLQFKRLTDYFENFRDIQPEEGVPSWLLPAGVGFVVGLIVGVCFLLVYRLCLRKQEKKSRMLRNTCLGLIFLSAVAAVGGGLFYTDKLPQEPSGLPENIAAYLQLKRLTDYLQNFRDIQPEEGVPSWLLPAGVGFVVGLIIGVCFLLVYRLCLRKQEKKSRMLRNTCLGLIFLSAVAAVGGGLFYTDKLPQEPSGLPENIAAYWQLKSLTDYFENFRGIQSGEGVPSWLLPAGMGFAVSLVFTAVSSLLVCLCCLGKTQRVKENQMGQKTEVNDTGNEHQTHHQVDETDLTLKTDVKQKQMGQKVQVNDTAKKDQKGQEFQTTPKRHKRHNMDEVDNTEQKKKIAELEQWNKELRDEISRANLVIENLKEKQEELCFHQIQRFEGFPGLFQIKHLEDFLHVHIFEVIMTLDEDTMNPYLMVSEDGRELRWTDQRQNLPDNPERFDEYPCVLGNRLPAEMRWGCYWEVEVGNKKSWELGVARDSVFRKGQLSLSPGAGFWVLSLWDGKLTALTDPETPLNTEVPRRVGIYVNYKEKKVHFYNADASKDSNKSEKYTLIHTFKEEIDRTVRPFFSPGNSDLDPLIITQDY
ncbi:uncharacterized protein [Lepisosteus oculatus]|uniref:uncharacterized protein n=1 Tax=Lepisosteus oculatus TaxID=7918 RepID=UPI0037157A9F